MEALSGTPMHSLGGITENGAKVAVDFTHIPGAVFPARGVGGRLPTLAKPPPHPHEVVTALMM